MSRRYQIALMACVLGMLFGMFRPLPVAAQETEVSLDTYRLMVRETYAASQRRDRLGLEDAGKRLLAVHAVQAADGQQLTVTNRWLESALAAADPDFALIEERLGAILDALALPDGSLPPDALQRLQDIFSHPPFRSEQPAQANNNGWWASFWRWVGRILDTIFRPVTTPLSVETGSWISWTVGIIAVVLLLGLILYLVLGLRRGMAAVAMAPSDDPEAHLTARTAFDQAGEQARTGDYRSAMRLMYLAALLWLDERGKIRYDRTLTNREYLAHVADNPVLYARLSPVVETFDRVWYGHLPLDASTFESYRRQVEELRRD